MLTLAGISSRENTAIWRYSGKRACDIFGIYFTIHGETMPKTSKGAEHNEEFEETIGNDIDRRNGS